jgi:Acetyltransferase (GNAT) domain
MRMLTQPRATPFLGPWVARSPDAKYAKALSDQMELQAELESRLPAAAVFRQSFSPTMINALPFVWAGYRAEVAYTNRLEDLGSEQALWDGLSGNIRREIRKARRHVVVRDDLGLDDFYPVWHETLVRQGRPAPSRDRLERIDAACGARDARAALFACDGSDRIHAVAYVVWDCESAYYLFGGSRPELRTSGAASLLLWEAILRARQVTRMFDFEGSMIGPIDRFFRAFGGRQVPYLRVSRTTSIAAGALGVREVAVRSLAALRRRGSSGDGPASTA